jgi:hypothetical protein
MHIEFLVEELSVEEALTHILPKILGSGVTFDMHPERNRSKSFQVFRQGLLDLIS